MRAFDDNTSWAGVRKELRYTLALLRAAGVHGPERDLIASQLGRWYALDQEIMAAEDAVDDADAGVAWCDLELDDALDGFALDLDHCARGDRASLTFTTFFPVPPSSITRMALGAEIEATKHFARAASDVTVSDGCKQSLARVEERRALGGIALEARGAAESGAASVAVRVRRFKEEANEARRAVYNALERHALEHKRGDDYADLFFRVPRRKAKKEGAKEGDAKGADAKGGAKAEPKAAPAADAKKSTPSVAPPA